MASTKFQLEESKKPNPRYILELQTIRGMVQEAYNMDKGLRIVLGFKLAAQGNPPAPQQPQQPPSMGPTPSSAQPAPPAMPPVTVGTTAGPQKKQSPALVPGGTISTHTWPPVPTISTRTPQAATPSVLNVEMRREEDPRGRG
jgi:hypothetical protein